MIFKYFQIRGFRSVVLNRDPGVLVWGMVWEWVISCSLSFCSSGDWNEWPELGTNWADLVSLALGQGRSKLHKETIGKGMNQLRKGWRDGGISGREGRRWSLRTYLGQPSSCTWRQGLAGVGTAVPWVGRFQPPRVHAHWLCLRPYSMSWSSLMT